MLCVWYHIFLDGYIDYITMHCIFQIKAGGAVKYYVCVEEWQTRLCKTGAERDLKLLEIVGLVSLSTILFSSGLSTTFHVPG